MKKQVKEIWLRFESEEEFSESEERLLEIIDKAPGRCVVKAYVSSIKSYKVLGNGFDEKQLSLLADFVGENNAKYQEKEVEVPKNPERKVPKIVQLIPCTHDLYATFDNENGEKCKRRVLMFALCSDHQIYPLHFDEWMGVCPLSEAIFDVNGYELENGEIWEGDGGKHEQ